MLQQPLQDKPDTPALGDYTIVIGNGYLPTPLPTPPAGLSVTALSAGGISNEQPDTLFGWLNNASLGDGLLLETERNTRVSDVVHVVFFNHSDTPCHAANRLQVRAG
jgi:hypothetical protein